jgi:hypothetical protein
MSLCSFSSELFCRVSLLSILSFSTVPAFASRDSVPDWVAAAAAKPLATYLAETSAVVLLDDTTLTVGADGKAVEHRRHVVKILRPNGREQGDVYIPYDKDTKILSLHVWSIAPDGKQYAVKDNEMMDIGYPGQGNFFEDIKARAVRAPGRDPGGVIAYEYDQRKEPYLHEETWMFQDDVPIVSQSFTLELPAGYTYGTVWAHHPEVKVVDLEHQRYRWEMNGQPAIDLDRIPMRPSFLSLAGRMTVHYAPAGIAMESLNTWRGEGEWYEPLMHDRVMATPDIAAKAAALTAGKTDFYDKTEVIGEYVQQRVRYFVIERGIGGQQPHPAADIFRNGYGDCKDKATLLSAMLSSVGVHSTLMAVDSRRGVIDPDAPSIVGNHMIAAIEIPKGYESAKLHSVITAKTGKRYLIFDPTWDKTAFGQLEYNLQGGYGVLFEGKDTESVRLPVMSPELNSVKRSGTFQLATDGTLKGSLTEKRFGDLSEDIRSLYTQGDAKQQRTYLDQSLSHDFTTVDVEGVKVENAASLNKELTTSYDLTAGRYSRSMGPLLMVRPRVLGSEGLAIDRKVRLVPIDLRGTRLIHDDFTIELPDGFTVDELPEPVKMDLGFASYESSSQITGKTLHYSRTYTVKQVSLPADKYGDLQKLALAIENDEQNHAVLKKQ